MSLVATSKEMSVFAKTVLDGKYAKIKPSGQKESWSEACERVAENVMSKYVDRKIVEKVKKLMIDRKFLAGGRYYANAGLKYPQINNCFLFDVEEDSRAGWADTCYKVVHSLMTGAGLGVHYSILRPEGAAVGGLGGQSTGPISLMHMVNELGRNIVQGGSRRSALYASLNWRHADIQKFIKAKDWSDDIKKMKKKDYNFAAPLDGTNISTILDTKFFETYNNEQHIDHQLAFDAYWNTVRHMVETAEPGFSIDHGENEGEILRNAPISANTNVLAKDGYKKVKDIIDLPITIWSGKQYVDDVVFKLTSKNAHVLKFQLSNGRYITTEISHEFFVVRDNIITKVPACDLQVNDKLHTAFPGDHYLPVHNVKILSICDAGNEDVYCCNVNVEEHSFCAEGVIISNCTEITSSDDSDVCNLGSINLARIESKDEFEEVVYYTICFLLCGTMYGVLPLPQMYKTREKNRRLGLGLMGLHEFLLRRGYKYGPNPELEEWLKTYTTSAKAANEWCNKFGISESVATRSLAPTGSISILGETTSAIEPIFATAIKRRYCVGQNSKQWKYQYIIDATAERIIESGIDPKLIEDAYDLSEDVERRIAFQAFVQKYVDHAISSTINLPKWGSSTNNENTVKSFGNILLKYLPNLRGITAYPDEARGGQPLNRVKYQDAIKHLGQEFIENGDQVVEFQEVGNERACVNGVCGV